MTIFSGDTGVHTRRQWLRHSARGVGLLACADILRSSLHAQAPNVTTPPPTRPPLQPVDITRLPAGLERLDLFLLLGQSNMKGRGFMPVEPSRDPRIVMMHLKDDAWYLARHPLHLVGDPKTFVGAR